MRLTAKQFAELEATLAKANELRAKAEQEAQVLRAERNELLLRVLKLKGIICHLIQNVL